MRVCLALVVFCGFGCDESSTPTPPAADSSISDTAADTTVLPADGSQPDARRESCFGTTYSDAAPSDATVTGDLVGDVFSLYRDSGTALYRWGYQGGTMITPRITLPAEVAELGTCMSVTFENLPDPAFPDAADGLLMWDGSRDEGITSIRSAGRSGPIFDQISWDDPTGFRFLLRTTVRGRDFAFTETVAIIIAPRDESEEP